MAPNAERLATACVTGVHGAANAHDGPGYCVLVRRLGDDRIECCVVPAPTGYETHLYDGTRRYREVQREDPELGSTLLVDVGPLAHARFAHVLEIVSTFLQRQRVGESLVLFFSGNR